MSVETGQRQMKIAHDAPAWRLLVEVSKRRDGKGVMRVTDRRKGAPATRRDFLTACALLAE